MNQITLVKRKSLCLSPSQDPQRRTLGLWFLGGVLALVFGGCGGLGSSPNPPGHRASTNPFLHKSSLAPAGHAASSTPGHRNTDGSPYNPSRYGRSGGSENPSEGGLFHHSCACSVLPSDVFVRPSVAYVICAHDPFDADGLLAGCTPTTNPVASQKIPPGSYCGSCICQAYPIVCSQRGQISF